MPSWIWVLLLIAAIAIIIVALLYFLGALTAEPNAQPRSLPQREAQLGPDSGVPVTTGTIAPRPRSAVPPPALAGPVEGARAAPQVYRRASAAPPPAAAAGEAADRSNAPAARRGAPPPAASAGPARGADANTADAQRPGAGSPRRPSGKPPPVQAAWSSPKPKKPSG